MGIVIVNGQSYSGRNITVINNRVIVDGQDVTPEGKVITITVTGDVERLKVDACQALTISGNCQDVETVSGSVEVGGSVSGSVKTVSGSVRCGNVGGKVSSVSGSIRHS